MFKPANPDFAAVVAASFAKQGFMATLGARLATIEPGLVVIEAAHAASLTQQQGLFHGGVIGALADNAGGYAALSLMPAGADVVTVEYKINFMRAAAGSQLRASGHVLRSGKTLTVARVDVTCGSRETQEACAVVQATFMRI